VRRYVHTHPGGWRNSFDLVELGNQIVKPVIVILVCVNGEQSVETCTQDIKMALGQQAYRDNTLFRQHSSPGVNKGNGWAVIKCLANRNG
jgi:hypothetical protein